MPKFIDLTNKVFERLTVIEHVGKDKLNRQLWKCKCVCGNEKTIVGNYLLNGDTKSCG